MLPTNDAAQTSTQKDTKEHVGRTWSNHLGFLK